VEIDHVLIRVFDLDGAARVLDAEHGLASMRGGRHPGWGTANRIVPLGETYLELVTVVDEREAAGSSFGRWAAEAASGPMGWCVRPPSLEAEAARLKLTVNSGSRPTASGELLTWRFAGFEQAAAEPALPFFIEWGDPSLFPGRLAAEHRRGPVELTELVLAGDAGRIEQLLGPHRLLITVRPGAPGLERIVLSGSAGQLVLQGALEG
jgi:glyoxalase-like protein